MSRKHQVVKHQEGFIIHVRGTHERITDKKWMIVRIACAAIMLVALSASQAWGGTWTKRVTTGPRPSERSTPAVAALGQFVYVFGGVKDDFSTGVNAFYNDLHRFNTRNDTWEELSPMGGPPPARAFAASVGHEDRGLMLVVGGANYGPNFSNFIAYDDLWAYWAGQNRWTQIQALNQGPSGRSRPKAWLVDDRLYIFGGVNRFFRMLNDLWVYDLSTNTWTQLIPDGAPGSPAGRHEAQGGAEPRRGKLTLYGGENFDAMGHFQTLNDTWEFDLATNTWTNVTPAPENNIQPARNYGSAVIIANNMILQGGDLEGDGSSGCGAPFPQNVTDELWQFDLVRHVWMSLAPDGDALARIKRTNAVVVIGKMYIFSGYDFQCVNSTGPGQVWNLDVYSYDPTGEGRY